MISYIISTRYGSVFLKLLLQSIERGSNYNNQIIVIADRPSWQILKVLRDRNMALGLDYFIVDHGHLCRNLDFGVKYAKFDYLCLTCADIIFSKNFDLGLVNTFKCSNEPLIFPAFYNGNTNNNSGYINLGRNKLIWDGKNMDWDKFDNIKVNRQYAFRCCGSPPVTIVHKNSYKQANGLTYHNAHPYGQELMFYERIKQLQIEVKYIDNIYFYHFGGGGNSDQQIYTEEYGIDIGVLKCANCNKLENNDNCKANNDTELGQSIRKTGLYLCNECQKKYHINTKEMKIERRENV